MAALEARNGGLCATHREADRAKLDSVKEEQAKQAEEQKRLAEEQRLQAGTLDAHAEEIQ